MTSRARIITFVLLLGFTNWAYAWQPDGRPRVGNSAKCHSQLWSHRYFDTRAAPQRAALLKEFIESCSDTATEGQPQGEAAENHWLDLNDHARDWKELTFFDTAGLIQTGNFLLQTRAGPRPLVVLACDFDCNPQTNPWLKTVAMQLYDEGGAHIYIAQSPESRLDKHSLWISGGLNYARDLLEAGRWLQLFSPYRGKFSSAHLLGLGWAGKSVLDGQLLNDRNAIADDRRVFHSTVAMCPAVQLDKVLSEIDRPHSPQSVAMREDIDGRMQMLRARDSQWAKWLTGWSPHEPLGERWIAASLGQTNAQGFPWMNPFRGNPPRTRLAWIEANDFIHQSLALKTPGWILGASNDPRFPALDHWQPLAQQHRDLEKSNLRVMGINESSTCALAASHDWNFSSAILRTLVLQEAYEIWPRYGGKRIPWPSSSPSLFSNEIHLEQHWNVDADGGISIEFFISNGSSTRSVRVQVAREQMPEGLDYDRADAMLATRQLNAWLRLHGTSGPLVHSREAAKYIDIRN